MNKKHIIDIALKISYQEGLSDSQLRSNLASDLGVSSPKQEDVKLKIRSTKAGRIARIESRQSDDGIVDTVVKLSALPGRYQLNVVREKKAKKQGRKNKARPKKQSA